MFNVGTPELLVILLVALVVLGPNKLPEAARQVGHFVGELRRMSTGFQTELRDAMQEPVSTGDGPRRSDPVPKATPPAVIKPVSQVIPDESHAADPSSASLGGPAPDPALADDHHGGSDEESSAAAEASGGPAPQPGAVPAGSSDTERTDTDLR